MVVFAPHNIIKDAPFTKLDLVTCRNLLIYLEPLAQKKALALFHFSLNVGGVLLLGPSESPGELADEFDTIDERWKAYRKRRDRRLHVDLRLPLSPGFGTPAPGGAAGTILPAPRVLLDAPLTRAYDALLADYAPPALLVNERRELVQSFAGAAEYLRMRDGRLTSDVLDLVVPELKIPIATALQQALKRRTQVVFKGIPIERDGHKSVKLSARPIADKQTDTSFFLLTIEPQAPPPPPPETEGEAIDFSQASNAQLSALEAELRYTRENLQATVEEMETGNEELQATNEELVASNEELQSTNEELHSVNEELYTVNAEYQKKIVELTDLTADMDNLLVSTEVGVIFLDAELCLRKYTPEIAHLFHLLPGDVGRHIESFAHTIHRPGLVEDLQRVRDTGQTFEAEVQDREQKPYLLRILPYRSRGTISGVVLTLIDISRLRQTEKELLLMSKVFQDGADPIIVEDLDGKIISLNAETERAYGWSRDELLGRHIDELLPPDQVEQARQMRAEVRRCGVLRNVESVRCTRAGGLHPVLLTLSLIADPKGQPMAIASIAKDISDRKRAEESVRDALRRRDQFLAMLSHELRNPLGAVLNATYVLEREDELPPVLAEAGRIIQRQSLQMARLLDDLLDVARVTQGKIEMRREVLDLTTLVPDAVQAVRPTIDIRNHQLVVDVAPGPIFVEGDAARLLQIQENLLTNAAKYTPPQGKIELSLGVEAGEAVLRVRDNGKGIPRHMLDAIFDLFVQSDETLDRSDGGMGLGLTLVKTLVSMHGGRISAQSPGANQGSEFIVRLPLVKAPRPTAADEAPRHPGAGDYHLLIVEDNPDSREMLEAILRFEGYRVTSAENGSQGMAAILHARPDVAIVDIGLPGMSGYELARQVRRQLGPNEVFLIALTGYGRPEDRAAALAAGFDAHLVKPFKPKELSQALGQLAKP